MTMRTPRLPWIASASFITLASVVYLFAPAIQAQQTPSSESHKHCELINGGVLEPCAVCTNGNPECENALPPGYKHGVCTSCSGCFGQTCWYYYEFNCGRGRDCGSGEIQEGWLCVVLDDATWCK
jgi:hypothetical protein